MLIIPQDVYDEMHSIWISNGLLFLQAMDLPHDNYDVVEAGMEKQPERVIATLRFVAEQRLEAGAKALREAKK